MLLHWIALSTAWSESVPLSVLETQTLGFSAGIHVAGQPRCDHRTGRGAEHRRGATRIPARVLQPGEHAGPPTHHVVPAAAREDVPTGSRSSDPSASSFHPRYSAAATASGKGAPITIDRGPPSVSGRANVARTPALEKKPRTRRWV